MIAVQRGRGGGGRPTRQQRNLFTIRRKRSRTVETMEVKMGGQVSSKTRTLTSVDNVTVRLKTVIRRIMDVSEVFFFLLLVQWEYVCGILIVSKAVSLHSL